MASAAPYASQPPGSSLSALSTSRGSCSDWRGRGEGRQARVTAGERVEGSRRAGGGGAAAPHDSSPHALRLRPFAAAGPPPHLPQQQPAAPSAPLVHIGPHALVVVRLQAPRRPGARSHARLEGGQHLAGGRAGGGKRGGADVASRSREPWAVDSAERRVRAHAVRCRTVRAGAGAVAGGGRRSRRAQRPRAPCAHCESARPFTCEPTALKSVCWMRMRHLHRDRAGAGAGYSSAVTGGQAGCGRGRPPAHDPATA